MEIKVSVIVPVFNAEKYIRECIQSLLNQKITECEFIFIDDGSKDNSLEIIKSFQKKDNRIILASQTNQGVSVARNKGMNLASGEYIGFVDADDYIKDDMFELLYKAAKEEDFDVIICNFKSEMNGNIYETTYPFPLNQKLNINFIENELLPYFIKADNLNSVVNKIYKNKIIKDKRLGFPKGLALGEDGLFNIDFFSHANTAKYINYTGYHYREVKGSATRDIGKKDYFKRALDVYNMNFPSKISNKIPKEEISKLRAIKLINSVISYIHLYLQPSKEISFKKRYQYVKKMIQNQDVRKALEIYILEADKSLSRYERFIVNMIYKKSTTALYVATAYSRYRNR
jgi:glycosyltransferase involved in cell wall biosynthesis